MKENCETCDEKADCALKDMTPEQIREAEKLRMLALMAALDAAGIPKDEITLGAMFTMTATIADKYLPLSEAVSVFIVDFQRAHKTRREDALAALLTNALLRATPPVGSPS